MPAHRSAGRKLHHLGGRGEGGWRREGEGGGREVGGGRGEGGWRRERGREEGGREGGRREGGGGGVGDKGGREGRIMQGTPMARTLQTNHH